MAVAKILFFLFLYHLLLLKVDSKCPQSFHCGGLGNLAFPFSKDSKCGLFIVEDCDSKSPRTQLEAGENWYNIRRDISTNKLFLHDPLLAEGLIGKSCFSFRNLSLPLFPFISFTFFPNLTLFTCSNYTSSEDIQNSFQNYHRVDCQNPPSTVYYRNPMDDAPATGERSIPSDCSMIQLPMKESTGELFPTEFILEWNVSEACYECYHGGGQCHSNKRNEFQCIYVKGNIMLIAGHYLGRPDELCFLCLKSRAGFQYFRP